MRRFFGQKINDDYIKIEENEFFHIKKVLRMNEKDSLICYTNDEFEYTCTIEKMNKNDCLCKIDKKCKCVGLPKNNITLFQMMPKKEYIDEIIPKSIELGVSHIYFFSSEFTLNKSLKKERVETQIMSACKQCERSKLLEFHDIIKFDKMIELLKNYDLVIFAYEDENNIFKPEILKNKKNIAIIVGNEAGFSQKEAEIISKKATSVSLGKRILRCDTAVCTLLSLVSVLTNN